MMIYHAEYSPGALASASLPTQLLIGPTQAWVLLLALLVLCGAALWLLAKPRGVSSQGRRRPPTAPRPGGHASRRRRPLVAQRTRRQRVPPVVLRCDRARIA
jgi:hypothetical protein